MEVREGDRLELRTPLEPLRREPRHAAELVSECLGGERLECVAIEGEWIRVRGEDDYEGWLHPWTCAPSSAATSVTFVGRFREPLGTLWVSDHRGGSPLLRGQPLLRVEGPLEERGGRRLVATSCGDEGWIEESAIEPFAGHQWTEQQLCDAGRGLLGTPYRWGGRSPLGFDCSGFVQYLFLLADRRLPRDARQQVDFGKRLRLEPSEFEPGDLLFFGDPVDHVGLWTGGGRILHCSGRVREEEMGKNAQLHERLCAARRVFDQLEDLGASWWAGRQR